MPEPDYSLVPAPSAQLALATNHLALLHKILPPALLGPVLGRSWEIAHLGLKMVWIEPGNFTTTLLPITEVTLNQGFWLGVTQVTQRQFEVVTGNNPSHFKNAGNDAPVERVSWEDAIGFCNVLTEQERKSGIISDKEMYALPTRSQWEYACRAGITGYYVGDIEANAWHLENSSGTTHPVGKKQPNGWGLFDMHGNVGEWAQDLPAPHKVAAKVDRIVNGGSWRYEADSFWCDMESFPQSFRSRTVGFRLALISVG